MKKFWLNALDYNKDAVICALESGADAVIVPDGKSGDVRELGKFKTV